MMDPQIKELMEKELIKLSANRDMYEASVFRLGFRSGYKKLYEMLTALTEKPREPQHKELE